MPFESRSSSPRHNTSCSHTSANQVRVPAIQEFLFSYNYFHGRAIHEIPPRDTRLARVRRQDRTLRFPRSIISPWIVTKSSNISPDHDSGNPLPTLPKFVRNCPLLSKSIRTRNCALNRQSRPEYLPNTKSFLGVPGLSDSTSRRRSGLL